MNDPARLLAWVALTVVGLLAVLILVGYGIVIAHAITR